MKVKCVSNESWDLLHNLRDKLTIGKIYDVISGPFYRIECDNGELRHIEANRFRELTMYEKRELKLEDLGI
jgi:hypothetical protein